MKFLVFCTSRDVMATIQIKNLTKVFPSLRGNSPPLRVLDNVSFSVGDGEFIALFGPNGCGKTTLLNILAGIETLTGGTVHINGKPPGHAKTGYVFQGVSESMLPWRTAAGNIEFALEIQGIGKEQRKQRSEELLGLVGMKGVGERYFFELSGGMKQLVAILRAAAYDPDVLVMDEPFASLDYAAMRKMEKELLHIWTQSKKTVLFVSHDVDEAVFLADKVVVLSRRPAVIRGVVPVQLPRPRTLEMMNSEAFLGLRKKVMELFDYEP